MGVAADEADGKYAPHAPYPHSACQRSLTPILITLHWSAAMPGSLSAQSSDAAPRNTPLSGKPVSNTAGDVLPDEAGRGPRRTGPDRGVRAIALQEFGIAPALVPGPHRRTGNGI